MSSTTDPSSPNGDPSSPLNPDDPSATSGPQIPEGEAFEEASQREVWYYGSAQVPNEMMGGMFNLLVYPIVAVVLGVNPALIGILLLVRGLVDAITDPLMAYFSDNFKSSMGRRRPFILWGGLAMVILGTVSWWIPRDFTEMQIVWYFGVTMIFFAVAQTVYSVPYFAFGIELSPTYNGRTRVAAVRTFFGRFAAISHPWLLVFCTLSFFDDAAEGARWLVVIIALISVPGIYLGSVKTRERRMPVYEHRESFLAAVAAMLTNIHFLRVTLIYALLLFVFGVFGAMSWYLLNFYVCGGDLEYSARLGAIGGTVGAIMGIVCIAPMDWLARKIQKHHALNVSVVIMLIGTVSAWWMLDPHYPMLSVVLGGIYGLGVACIFTVLPSLHADVIDYDEYKTGRRREGMLGAAAAFLMKTSQAVGAGISGFLINWTGFDQSLGGDQTDATFFSMRLLYAVGACIPLIPVILILIRYPLTEKEVHRIQFTLKERRNGNDNAADDSTLS